MSKPLPVIQPEKPVKKLDFSVDYNIPTLEDIALPGDESTTMGTKLHKIPIPKHILKSESSKQENENNGVIFSPELIDQLSHDLQLALTAEIDKAITYALNNALATVMDQTAKITKMTVRKRVEELLPKLLKEHIENISQNDSPK